VIIDLDNLGGRLKESLTLYARSSPYIIRADITIMPGVRNRLFYERFMSWTQYSKLCREEKAEKCNFKRNEL
jgi:hypothetical protein